MGEWAGGRVECRSVSVCSAGDECSRDRERLFGLRSEILAGLLPNRFCSKSAPNMTSFCLQSSKCGG